MSNGENRDTAALNYAQQMHVWYADLRVKNFNMFLLITGAITTAIISVNVNWQVCLLALLGSFIGILFMGLDLRTNRLIRDTRAALYILEPKFDVSIFNSDQIRDEKHGVAKSSRLRLLTTTSLYNAVLAAEIIGGLVVARVAGCQSIHSEEKYPFKDVLERVVGGC